MTDIRNVRKPNMIDIKLNTIKDNKPVEQNQPVKQEKSTSDLINRYLEKSGSNK